MTTESISLRELINMLEAAAAKYGDDTPIFIAQPSHDRWHTTLAVEPKRVDFLPIRYSDYHDGEVLLGKEEDPDEYRVRDVCVLRTTL